MTRDELREVLDLHRRMIEAYDTLDRVREVLRVPRETALVEAARTLRGRLDDLEQSGEP